LKPEIALQHILKNEYVIDPEAYSITLYPVSVNNHIETIIVTFEVVTLNEKLRLHRDLLWEREKAYKAGISHHFFNPLAIAKGYLQLTLDECSDDVRTRLCSIKNALDRIEDTVKTIIKTGSLEDMNKK
jgi:signal transduction histidine kinase